MGHKKIEWERHFSVGNKNIDNQHQQLVNLYNMLVESTENETITTSLLDSIIRQLIHYIEYHFAFEETLFRKYNYPKTESHLEEHRSFIKKMGDFHKVKPEELPDKMVNFLNSWIFEHITICDKDYSYLFQKNEKEKIIYSESSASPAST